MRKSFTTATIVAMLWANTVGCAVQHIIRPDNHYPRMYSANNGPCDTYTVLMENDVYTCIASIRNTGYNVISGGLTESRAIKQATERATHLQKIKKEQLKIIDTDHNKYIDNYEYSQVK